MAGKGTAPVRLGRGQKRTPSRLREWVPLWVGVLSLLSFLGGMGLAGMSRQEVSSSSSDSPVQSSSAAPELPRFTAQGWPLLDPKPQPDQVWDCELVVIGGSLGGVAAASHAMRAGIQTCLIELTPWLGGQITSQGVSAIDESLPMRQRGNFSSHWLQFKALLESQPVHLPAWTGIPAGTRVADINSCWVGGLCFPPKAGVKAVETWLEQAAQNAPNSRWATQTAFKGATFSPDGSRIESIYAVQRQPRDPDFVPPGRLWRELASWYGWGETEVFAKRSVRLQAPPGRELFVIDATDTGELVGWAGIPYRVGSESRELLGEPNGAPATNPECTQAFTFPFVMAIHDDGGRSKAELAQLQPGYSRAEHRREFDMEGFPTFSGQSFFNYRRIVSKGRTDPFYGTPVPGDLTMVNWNRGNDWGIMNPPLILTEERLQESGQRHNWLGGLDVSAIKDGENHALLFAEWLMETQPRAGYPLSLLFGEESLMGTRSGLSLYPYIREGRRILGRAAYGQSEFMMLEQDIRIGTTGGRDFTPTVVGVTHYAIDIHGCRYRNWEPSLSASSAPINEFSVHPIRIPLEALIPQRLDNLLIGGKGIAVSHIVNAATRVHYGEWIIGSAAGLTAAWLGSQEPSLTPAQIVPRGKMAELQSYLVLRGQRLQW
ncbi:FAD-dependent oxidoreductase [Synechococcus sp. Nb3U1]|uniref:FAD-dependent oxidoreductase n=1 Tax=Synechococcus sp. Nb3U1 TaxID=1914529 RepID=UPI001F45B964|nr:FAD-dependent oxidoreductase [Synechococcus sp. Nb3U1]MCF2970766.1 FAD-dependent oxidoreductase [Synechococcus sp. Nb3U1]